MIFLQNTLKMYQLEKILDAIKQASEAVLSIYKQDFQIFRKQDLSPLTQADSLSHQILVEFLSEHTPNIPIISEEEEIADWEERKNWEYFWLIDPLDGTNSFVRGGQDYTVNVGLVEDGEPRLGLVLHPPSGSLWTG
ncbi:MAG: 3'(2'),5'-bisphosphate nucleotidase CysQ, partial [Raineya sp.]